MQQVQPVNIIPNLSFLIEEIYYFPTRQQVPMYLRPYVFNTDDVTLNMVNERMEQNHSGTVTPAILSGLAGGLIQPSSVGVQTGIDNAWVSQDRYIFMLRARHVNHFGMEVINYVFGYTDHAGITPTGAVDPNMQHYINNVIETVVDTITYPTGAVRSEKLHSIYNTIASNSPNQADLFTQRPVDIYNTYSMNQLAQFSDVDANFFNASSVITPFSNNVVTSTTENSITTEYLGKILTSGIQSFKTREVHVNAYQMGSSDPAEKFFTEPSVNECAFVRTLSRAAGFRNVVGNFTFSAMMSMDPTVYDRFELFNTTSDFSNPLLTRTPEVGEDWVGQDMITTRAYSLMSNSVAMATKYGFTRLYFIATNKMDVTGTYSCSITNWKSFLSVSQQDQNYLIDLFKDRFNMEIFLNETNMGRVPVYMECYVDLLGTTKIYLEYGGYQGVWFTAPTFANSLYRPEITTDQGMVEVAATHIGQAIEAIAQSGTAQGVVQYY